MAAAVAAAVASVAGCVSNPEIPYDRSSASAVKSIGILAPSFPDGPTVVLASSVGQSFGLIGALVDAGMQSNRDSTFEHLLEGQRFSAQDTFVHYIAAGLRADGYRVVMIPVNRSKADFVASYPKGPANGVDAYLDIVAQGYGYIAAGISAKTPYRPDISLKARLVEAKDSSVLMQEAVAYNPVSVTKDVITITPDAEYEFKDFDALVADPNKATTGLKMAMQHSAEMVATLLK
jgi:hypothetical protein